MGLLGLLGIGGYCHCPTVAWRLPVDAGGRPRFLIVLGGTVGAVTLQTPAKYILLALRQLLWIFIPPRQDLATQAERLQSWAVFARQQGLLALENQAEQEEDNFTRQGLGMIVDGVSTEDIRMLLEADIDIEQERNEHAAVVFEAMGVQSDHRDHRCRAGPDPAMFHLEDPQHWGRVSQWHLWQPSMEWGLPTSSTCLSPTGYAHFTITMHSFRR